MNLNPYKVLGVRKTAGSKTIRAAYRRLSKQHHPDVGGDEEEFKKISWAYSLLSDEVRRSRYDATGRVDEGVTREKVVIFLKNFFHSVVNYQRPDGSMDSPEWEDILDKVLRSIRGGQQQVRDEQRKARQLVKRTKQLIARFKPLQEDDPVGDILRDKLKDLENQLKTHDDALEMSLEAEKILKTYSYEMGPDPEGQDGSDPTSLRLTTGGVLVTGSTLFFKT